VQDYAGIDFHPRRCAFIQPRHFSFCVYSMSIQVTCPGCLTRFQVNDKFAGKKGPCPKCKAQIMIPTAEEAVVIHAPEEMGPKDSEGRPVLKPLAREDAKVTRTGLLVVSGAIVLAVGFAIGLRFTGEVPVWLRVLSLLLVAPPLVAAGYSFARDPELAPYRGQEFWLRLAILAVVFPSLWMIYAFVPAYLFELKSAAHAEYWLVGVACTAMVAGGAVAAMATFELEFSGGLAISALYFVATLGLAVLAGITLANAS
jgi:hypothetical protein